MREIARILPIARSATGTFGRWHGILVLELRPNRTFAAPRNSRACRYSDDWRDCVFQWWVGWWASPPSFGANSVYGRKGGKLLLPAIQAVRLDLAENLVQFAPNLWFFSIGDPTRQ